MDIPVFNHSISKQSYKMNTGRRFKKLFFDFVFKFAFIWGSSIETVGE